LLHLPPIVRRSHNIRPLILRRGLPPSPE
jgi:hypothetical protein